MSHEKLTVMGPEALSSSTRGANHNQDQPPMFVTNHTIKSKYRDDIRGWIQMLIMFAEVDTKSKAMVNGAGPLVYRACDDYAQQIIQSAETSASINLKGSKNDPTREALVEQIINIIAKDSTTELMRMEVELLNNIQTCVRRTGESPHMFANRYTGTVARYVNQTSELTELTSRQFAVTMLRNAKLTPDTLNSLMFQLTTKISIKMAGAKTIQIQIRDTDALAINGSIKDSSVQGTPNFDVIDNFSNNISALITRSKAECNVSVIGMDETAQSRAQVRVVAEGAPQENCHQGIYALKKDKWI